MRTIRSILWIGPGSGLAESGVLDTPTLDVTWVADLGEALRLPPAGFDAEIVDGLSGDALLGAVRRLVRGPRRSPVIARVREPDPGLAAELRAAGAGEVLPATLAIESLQDHVDSLSEARQFRRSETSVPDDQSLPGVVGTSQAMRSLCALVRRARESSATVLLSGETGVGKEVIARALHDSGARAGRPFVAVNCAAFPDSLLESELFGHVKGAFTGADRDKPGLFEVANGGTLFLDEIGETSTALQASLLRVLQEREIRPVGGTRSRPIDARVIAASNRSLRAETQRGAFREDLYYRLAVFPIRVPPLRERRDDIIPLAEHFLAHHGAREGKPNCRLSHAAAHLLMAHDWPGNVRELENEMHRALALADVEGPITPKILSESVTDIVEPIAANTRRGETLRESMSRIEAWLIRRALEQHGGRRTATARKLGVTREGLYKKMKRLGVD